MAHHALSVDAYPRQVPSSRNLREWSRMLTAAFGEPSRALHVSLVADRNLKAKGGTRTFAVRYRSRGRLDRCFVKMPAFEHYGEDLYSDSGREIFWRLEGYPLVPQHSRCIAALRLEDDGSIECVRSTAAIQLVVEAAEQGTTYATHLQRYAKTVRPGEPEAQARQICRAMIAVHQPIAGEQDCLYHRAIRDTLSQPVMRLIDAAWRYWAPRPAFRSEVERLFVQWRQILSARHHRLRRTHNDFHPWNLLMDRGTVRLIGARLPGYGDPANDVAALTVNYLWFGDAAERAHKQCYLRASRAFWDEYVAQTGDAECLEVLPPFLAMRLLVFIDRRWYPQTTLRTARRIEEVLVALLRLQIKLPMHALAVFDGRG